MKQKEQVIVAIRKLGGRATFSQIFSAIDTSKWTAQYPKNTVYSILSRGKDKEFFKDGKNHWVYKKRGIAKKVSNNAPKSSIIKRGLYLIIPTEYIKFRAASYGFFFKIGSADNLKVRLKNYNRLLPCHSIEPLYLYEVSSNIQNLNSLEKKVRENIAGKIFLGKTIEPYFGGSHLEWLYIQGLIKMDIIERNKFIKFIQKSINNTIANF